MDDRYGYDYRYKTSIIVREICFESQGNIRENQSDHPVDTLQSKDLCWVWLICIRASALQLASLSLCSSLSVYSLMYFIVDSV